MTALLITAEMLNGAEGLRCDTPGCPARFTVGGVAFELLEDCSSDGRPIVVLVCGPCYERVNG